jgi:hypothetical protein
LKKGRKHSLLAASEVMGAVVMLAVTLSVGFGAWAWARTAAVNSEKNFGNDIIANISCLNQSFVITNANFSSTSHNTVTVWFFNNGFGVVSIAEININNSTSSNPYSYANVTASTTIAKGTGSQDNSGQAVIAVASTYGFAVGNKVELNTGGARDETLIISSIGSGTITFSTNLQYTHPVGDTVFAPAGMQLAAGKITSVLFKVPTTLSGQWDHPGTPSLYSFSAVDKCQGDIISNYQQAY